MQFDNIPAGILSLLTLSLPLLKIPIIFILPFSKIEPFDNKILASGVKIEFNTSKTAGEALLIPWNNIKFLGFSSLDFIASYNLVS